MTIETEITGSPGSIRSVARWLGGTLKPALGSGSDGFVGARRTASSEWRGETSTAFCGAMGRAVTDTDALQDQVGEVRRVFDDYAGSLERCQERMTTIREDARAADLTVTGFVVQPPGPGPDRPADLPAGSSPTRADAHGAAVVAYDDHQEKIRAFNRLVERADEVWADLGRAWERVSAKDHGPTSFEWGLNATAIAGGVVEAGMQAAASKLSEHADAAREVADYERDQVRRHGHQMTPETADERWRNSMQQGRNADDLATRASDVNSNARLLNRGLGALGFLAGTGYDIQNGESLEQAVVSNGVGLGASIATGALVGTAIGGPVGTVVGVVAGTVVGIAGSEFVDSMWESGGDVLDSALAAGDAVLDTGGDVVDAVGDAGGAVINEIGSWF